MSTMTSTANGTAHHEGDPSISWPLDRNGHTTEPSSTTQTGSGNGHQQRHDALAPFEKQYYPGQSKSLSGIALRALTCGFVLSSSLTATIALLAFTDSPLWRLPFFITALSTFHFLEFWTTAAYNTRAASVSSFLFSQNGSAYQVAHATAMVECLLSNLLFPGWHWVPAPAGKVLLGVGLLMMVVGQTVRTVAMKQAGTNFNHMVQHQKASEHQLVTSGIYGYLRHPSYFGFFWWGLGTQVVLGNVVCFLGYAAVLWRFFHRRIGGENGRAPEPMNVILTCDYRRRGTADSILHG
jgi:protein-S-isoprenylcysteine O-methyltransferase